MGLELDPTALRGKSAEGKLAAHILQGTEARFIQELTLLSPKYGFKPITNEHDGLVVIGEISDMAQQEARRLTGLSFMALELKNGFGAFKSYL